MQRQRATIPRRYLVGALTFVVLSVLAFWYQLDSVPAGASPPTLADIRWGWLPVLLLAPILEPLFGGLRMWIVCRTLGHHVGFWHCFKAEMGNIGVAMLTPSQSGGAVAQVYFLNKGGVPAAAAISTTVLTFMGTVVVMLALGLWAVLGPHDLPGGLLTRVIISVMFVAGLGVFGAALWTPPVRAALGILSRAWLRFRNDTSSLRPWYRPGRDPAEGPLDEMGPIAHRISDVLYNYRDELYRFLRVGRLAFLGVCLCTAGFLATRAGLAIVSLRLLGLDDTSVLTLLGVQAGILFLIYLAPTPGAAGIAESVSLAMMGGIVPIGFTPYYHVLWRMTTQYMVGCTGLAFLGFSLLRDLRRKLTREDSTLAGDAAAP